MKKLTLFIVVNIITPLFASAYDFEVDGIYYSITSEANSEVCVTYKESTASDIVYTYSGTIIIPEMVTYGNKSYHVTSIGGAAFNGCINVSSVKLPNSIRTIEYAAFSKTGIESIDIPNSVISIGRIAFNKCKELTLVNLSDNLTSISEGCFKVCPKLSNITIPSGVTTIEDDAFYGCEELLSINIPSGVKSIGQNAFSGCGLKTITIPSTVTSIGLLSFISCKNLEHVYSQIMEPFTIRDDTFKGISSSAILHIPNGTKSLYMKYSGWTKNFKYVLEEDENIPPSATFNVSISSSGSGYAVFEGETIQNVSKTFNVVDGYNFTVSFFPDEGCFIKSAKVNTMDITAHLYNNSFSMNITSDTSIDVVFEELVSSISSDGVNYLIASLDEHTIVVTEGDYGFYIDIPSTVSYRSHEWNVIGIEEDALKNSTKLSAIIWNPAYKFDARVPNPNLLLYVKSADYAPSSVNNVIVNGTAKDITLTDAHSGNDFYCPQAFTAEKISYTHRYGMKTGIGESRGWETIALPFDVQHITLSEKEIKPFASWRSGDAARPFWLYQFGSKGFAEAESIKAYMPYLISLPNNEKYVADYRLAGNVKFSAENVEIKKSDEVNASSYNGRRFVPNFATQEANAGLYALNVNNEYETYQGGEAEGSKFILNLRKVHPFEAYMTTSAGTRSIEIFDQMTTAIKDNWMTENNPGILRVYDLSGKMVGQGSSIEEIKRVLPAGVYIVNHQKIIIK